MYFFNNKKLLANLLFFIIFLIISVNNWSIAFDISNQKVKVNQIEFSLEPYIQFYFETNHTHTVEFILDNYNCVNNQITFKYISSGGSIDYYVKIYPSENFQHMYQVEIKIDFRIDIKIRNISLNLNFSQEVEYYQGPQSIQENSQNKNFNLVPYTNRVIQYSNGNSSMWLIGSNYLGVKGVETINGNVIKFYDNNFHAAPLLIYHLEEKDWRPIDYGSSLEYSFLISSEKPIFPEINNYPGNKKAALCITNDADRESNDRLRVVYFGSSNEDNQYYLNRGLIANNIPVSNTVFGVNIDSMQNIWEDLKYYGNSIGLHTYDPHEDDLDLLRDCLLDDMQEFDVRLWIDHAWVSNPEDICHDGCDPTSNHYVMDILSDAHIDYAWIGYNRINSFNAFDDYRQLPHRVYSLNTTHPIMYFERRMALYWKYHAHPEWDWYHVVTPQKLDELIEQRGLTILYTHFSRPTNSSAEAFFDALPSGELVIKSEVEDNFKMLNVYSIFHGLWIDTIERIFDRLIAIDSVKITKIQKLQDHYRITFRNNSDITLDDFSFNYGDEYYYVDTFEKDSEVDFSLPFENYENLNISDIDYCIIHEDTHIVFRFFNVSTNWIKKIKLYNIKGQYLRIKNYEISFDEIRFNMNDKPSGTYFVVFSNANDKKVIRFIYLK